MSIHGALIILGLGVTLAASLFALGYGSFGTVVVQFGMMCLTITLGVSAWRARAAARTGLFIAASTLSAGLPLVVVHADEESAFRKSHAIPANAHILFHRESGVIEPTYFYVLKIPGAALSWSSPDSPPLGASAASFLHSVKSRLDVPGRWMPDTTKSSLRYTGSTDGEMYFYDLESGTLWIMRR
jgi:hypothetical protein